jgi:hypothetical protein
MRRSLLLGLGFLFAGGLSCYDARSALGPDAQDWRKVTAASECVPLSREAMNALVDETFTDATGGPNLTAFKGGELNALYDATTPEQLLAAAQDVMEKIFEFRDLHPERIISEAKVAELMSAVMCVAGVDFQVDDIDDVFIVEPDPDNPQTFINNDGTAGFIVPAGGTNGTEIVSVVLLEFVPGLLDTKLDVHPLLFSFQRSGTGNFPEPWIISVCPGPEVPDDVFPYLLLGHQHNGVFKLLPEPEGPGVPLTCEVGGSTVDNNRQGGLVVADMVALNLTRGSVSGSTSTFSEIGTTDRRGGASSSTSTFSPQNWGMLLDVNLASCASSYAVGTDVPPQCRPSLTITTPLGEPLLAVPIDFEVKAGGGAVARFDPTLAEPDCVPPFGTLAEVPTASNPAGTATACWRLGLNPGTNTVWGTPKHGGDALDPLIEFGEFVNGVWTPKEYWGWNLEATDDDPSFIFNGFFSPIRMPPLVNTAKAGNTIPVKFTLGGDFGLDVFVQAEGSNLPYPQVVPMTSCTGDGYVLMETTSTETAGGSVLSYNAVTGQYTYAWKTDKRWANSCRELRVKFVHDGTNQVYSAWFEFKK